LNLGQLVRCSKPDKLGFVLENSK